MRRFSTRDLTLAAAVAALYAVLGYFGDIFSLTFGAVQFRFAEALGRPAHGTLNGLRAKKQANNRRSGKQSKQHAARTHGRPLLFSCDRFRIHSMYGKAFRRPLQGGED